MDPANIAILVKELRHDEGVRYTEYLDTNGVPSTGVGHNLRFSPLPVDWSYPLTDDQVNQLLINDLDISFQELYIHCAWWVDMDPVRQRVLANMNFNMGITRLMGFVHFLADCCLQQYESASMEMRNSLWFKQVGERAERLYQEMLTGVEIPV